MRIAYFINQYPMVSHSFIRREIQALEKQGCEITRIALRVDEQSLVDPRDKDELLKTRLVLKQSAVVFMKAVLLCVVLHPIVFLRTFRLAIAAGRKSERGILRHIAYFIEACVVSLWVNDSGIQHIHAHFGTNSTTVTMLAAQLGNISYSFTVHGPEEFDKPEALSLSEKIKRAAFVVAISSFGKSQLSRWVDHNQWEKLKVVHCGLDNDFHAGVITPVGDVQRIVCVGRLCEQKAQPLLLDAIHLLELEGREFELVLAGDGPLRSEVESLITAYNLQDKVRITGWISSDQVKDELLQARALVLPSFAEGLPVVIMEAMALGRPVISTYVAGIPELVVPGENGWLVTAGDVSELADALREVLDMKPAQLRQRGKKARARVLERHDIDTEAAKLLSHFKYLAGTAHE